MVNRDNTVKYQWWVLQLLPGEVSMALRNLNVHRP